MPDPNVPASYGWRRRCAWCCRVLRGWQLNRCRRCKHAGGAPGLYQLGGDYPHHGTQYNAPADRWAWPWAA